MKTIELLAPAGNLNSALAAFDAGADAVYAGMKHFNARERGDNFTDEELAKLAAYAHKIGKKLYITFNTVIKESEIPAAAAALAELDYIHPDALIVQDIGAVRMIREFFPGLRIHGSTQMALHDSMALQTAKEMGLSRVILERQITLEELKKIAQNSPLELEVFVHGALCCCLSGTCLFSSWLGGASGNRGQCKQPCRRMFRSSSGKSGFYFSTRDLAAFSLIRDFREMGIASVKIEGRLRKADYVSSVVKAYRMVLDASDSDFEKACREAAMQLSAAASRKPSLGFYTKQSAAELVRPDSPGGIGREVGRVTAAAKGVFEAQLSARIHVGDSLRIQNANGDEGKTFTLLDLRINGKPVLKAGNGDHCRIECSDYEVFRDGILYKVGESVSAMEKRIAALPPYKPQIDFTISVSENGFHADYRQYHWDFPAAFAQAKTHPFDIQKLTEGFSAPGDAALAAGNITAEIRGELFVPVSVMKEARRSFWGWLTNLVFPASLREESRTRAEHLLSFHTALHAGKQNTGKIILDHSGNSEYVLPFFTPETELAGLEEKISERIRKGEKIFRLTSLSHFAMLKKFTGLTLKLMLPVPIANSFAVLEAQHLGADSAVIHIELGREDMLQLVRKSVLPLETYCYGRPVIFATRAGITEMESFSEMHGGETFLLHKNGPLTLILPETPVALPCIPGTVELIDRREITVDTTKTSTFNYERGLK